MTDLKELIEQELDQYLEWPTADKSHVTTVSAKLFAEHVARLYADHIPDAGNMVAPVVQGEPVAVLLIGEPEHTKQGWELGDWDIEPNATAIEAFAKLAEPGAYQLCLAPQPAEQQPAPDVAGLVDALDRIANLPLNSCSTENDYRLSAAKAIALAAVRDFRDAAIQGDQP